MIKFKLFIEIIQNELLIKTLFNFQSFLWSFMETFSNELSEFKGSMLRKNNLRVDDLIVRFVVWVGLKGWISYCEFIGQYPDFPDVDWWIVCRTFDHFRCKVVKCATKRVPSFIWVDWPSKISQLYVSQRYQKIFWLDISMDDGVWMQVSQGL